MAEKDKSWKEKINQTGKGLISKFTNPETRQEMAEKVAKENEAFNKKVEELRKKNPSQGKFKQAVLEEIKNAYDEETKQRWREVYNMSPSKDGKVDNKNNNIQQPQADNTKINNGSKVDNNITQPQPQADNTQIDNNTAEEKTSFIEDIKTAANKVKEGVSGVANNVVEGVKNNKDDTTTTGNTTTTTPPETTLTKESAWDDYNKDTGTAKGLFESFKTLEMTAEEARKEFLSKVSTPSDAAKKAFKETYGVDLVVTDEDDDKDKNKNKNKKYKSSMYGIIDAMKNGDIDPSTGVYFMLDALSKAARNTGIDIGNIGAQFSGGTVRDDYQDSLWSQRRNKMFENEMTSELNKQEGTDKEMEYNLAKEDLIGKGLTNEQADLALEASRTFKDKAKEFRKAGNDTMADLYALVGSAATKEVGPEELAAIAASNVLNTPEGKEAADEIIESLTGLVGTVGSTLGGINSVLSFFTDWKNKKNK